MGEKDLTGRDLERRVANAYRQMGATKVEHDVEIAGNQIDVYVELPTPGHLMHRVAVEAKDYSKPVGVEIVNHFAQIVDLLRRERLIDEGVIVGTSGFSRPARNAAEIHGIVLRVPEDLDAMVQQEYPAGSTKPAVPITPPPVTPPSEKLPVEDVATEIPDSPSVSVVHELLLAAFTARDLYRLFMYASPDSPLRPLLNRISKEDNLANSVDEVIEYCATRHLFSDLLTAVKKANPRQYERFEARLKRQR